MTQSTPGQSDDEMRGRVNDGQRRPPRSADSWSIMLVIWPLGGGMNVSNEARAKKVRREKKSARRSQRNGKGEEEKEKGVKKGREEKRSEREKETRRERKEQKE